MSPFWLYQPLPNTFLLLSAHLVTGMERKKELRLGPAGLLPFDSFWGARRHSNRAGKQSKTQRFPLKLFLGSLYTMHFVRKLLLQANFEKTIEASMDGIWSALETSPVLYLQGHQQGRRGCPLPRQPLFLSLLFSPSYCKNCGNALWMEITLSWPLSSNMDECLAISYLLGKTRVSTLGYNRLIWDRRLSSRRNKC